MFILSGANIIVCLIQKQKLHVIVWSSYNLNFSILYLSFLNIVNLKIFLVLDVDSIDENLIRLEKRGKIHFENKIAICPSCKSTHNVKNGIHKRKLIFLRIGKKICSIQKYKCKKCGKTFYTDLSSLVYDNSNITFPVFDCIENLYQIYGAGLHKIRYYLKKQHNVEISHQSIENIFIKL